MSIKDFMAEVFYDIAEQSPETLIAMAEMDQALYETMAYDPYYNEGGMSAENLMKDIMGTSDTGFLTWILTWILIWILTWMILIMILTWIL